MHRHLINVLLERYSFPILDTERWAQSWSRCTDSQPASDFLPGSRLPLLSTRPVPLPRKRSPDGATTDWDGEHLLQLTTHLSTRNYDRLSWSSWLVYSKSGHPSAECREWDRESSPDRRSTTVLCHQPKYPSRASIISNCERLPCMTEPVLINRHKIVGGVKQTYQQLRECFHH